MLLLPTEGTTKERGVISLVSVKMARIYVWADADSDGL